MVGFLAGEAEECGVVFLGESGEPGLRGDGKPTFAQVEHNERKAAGAHENVGGAGGFANGLGANNGQGIEVDAGAFEVGWKENGTITGDPGDGFFKGLGFANEVCGVGEVGGCRVSGKFDEAAEELFEGPGGFFGYVVEETVGGDDAGDGWGESLTRALLSLEVVG